MSVIYVGGGVILGNGSGKNVCDICRGVEKYLATAMATMSVAMVWSSAILTLMLAISPCGCAAPTDGFAKQPLTASNFEIQKPYDKEVSERYQFSGGVQRLWVFVDDKPFQTGSDTKPRTEIRIRGYDYTSGVWQFEGDLYVPSGTTGTAVIGGVRFSTALQLRVYDGNLKRYNSEVVATGIYDKWIHINVIHDADQGRVEVFVDGVKILTAEGRETANHYFKCGVYVQDNPSDRMECRWRNINLWKQRVINLTASDE